MGPPAPARLPGFGMRPTVRNFAAGTVTNRCTHAMLQAATGRCGALQPAERSRNGLPRGRAVLFRSCSARMSPRVPAREVLPWHRWARSQSIPGRGIVSVPRLAEFRSQRPATGRVGERGPAADRAGRTRAASHLFAQPPSRSRPDCRPWRPCWPSRCC